MCGKMKHLHTLSHQINISSNRLSQKNMSFSKCLGYAFNFTGILSSVFEKSLSENYLLIKLFHKKKMSSHGYVPCWNIIIQLLCMESKFEAHTDLTKLEFAKDNGWIVKKETSFFLLLRLLLLLFFWTGWHLQLRLALACLLLVKNGHSACIHITQIQT